MDDPSASTIVYIVTEVEVKVTRFFTAKTRFWIASAALSITSMVLAARYLSSDSALSPVFYPTLAAASALTLTFGHGDGPFGDAGVVLWAVVFIVVTFVTWTLVWYAALSVLLRGIKLIRDRPG